MQILRSIDIEDEVRKALIFGGITAYCRLPQNYLLPNIQVHKVGGTDNNNIDTFEITIDARATTEEEADETLRTSIGVLKEVAKLQNTALRFVEVNTSGGWGNDPVRPDLVMCTARLRITAHQEKTIIQTEE